MSPSDPRITQCRCCHSPFLVEVFNLGYQSWTGRFVRPGIDVPQAPVVLVRCVPGPKFDDACGLVQLAHNFDPAEMYGDNYPYRSSITATMRNHLSSKVAKLKNLVGTSPGDVVVDVGCNDGTLLSSYNGLGLQCYGIDPSSGNFLESFPSEATLVVDFFSYDGLVKAGVVPGTVKILTAIAMFYDLPDPLEFLRDARRLLAPGGVIELEMSYLAAMLEARAYDTLCHEHLAYFALTQINWLAERAQLRLVDVERNLVNGGSFNILLTRDGENSGSEGVVVEGGTERVQNMLAFEASTRLTGGPISPPLDEFAGFVRSHQQLILAFFREATNQGLLVLGYGASTKGNVTLQHCGLGPSQLPAILERDPRKFGCVTPGTQIPIISEAEGRDRNPQFLFVLPWHFRDEIVARETAFLQTGGRLVFPLPKFEVVGVGGVASPVTEAAPLGGEGVALPPPPPQPAVPVVSPKSRVNLGGGGGGLCGTETSSPSGGPCHCCRFLGLIRRARTLSPSSLRHNGRWLADRVGSGAKLTKLARL